MANGRRPTRKSNSVNIPNGAKATKGTQPADNSNGDPANTQEHAVPGEATTTSAPLPQNPPLSPLTEPEDMEVDPKGATGDTGGDDPEPIEDDDLYTSAYATKNPFEALDGGDTGTKATSTTSNQHTGPSPVPTSSTPSEALRDPEQGTTATPGPADTPAPPTPPSQPMPKEPVISFGGVDSSKWAEGAREHFEERQKAKFTFDRTEHFRNAASVGITPDGDVRFVSDTVGGDDSGRENLRPKKRARPAPEPERPSSPPTAPDTPTPSTRRRAAPTQANSATQNPPGKITTARDFLDQVSFLKSRAPLKVPSHAPEPQVEIFTSGPFPAIYDAHAAAPLDNIDKDQVAEWWSTPGFKVLLRVLGKAAWDPKALATLAAKMAAMVTEGFGEEDPLIAAPIPAVEGDLRAHAPSTFLLHGISEETATAALSMEILDTKEISVQVLPFKLRNPALVLLIEGFSTTRTELIRQVIDKTWRSDASSARLTGFIKESEDEDDSPLTVQQVSDFLASLRIIRIDMKGTGSFLVPHFAAIADGDTIPSLTHWVTLRDHFAELTYRSNLVGTGSVIPFLDCAICHGCDHPRGLCPFPSIPGWQGPGSKADTAQKASRGRGGSRGGSRGRAKHSPYDDSRDNYRRGHRQ
ncbi:hypothetical protein FA95DRAFT_1570061 [Auriscalpium vulgare]|uniref:Uncharacterized protein n=1 Tax=Auriscalpium vulgare TaxID=40419 RepID=A0ACB8S3X7_9AGAM|nr:hypothetical protein FA95DRAFT_1570061 [Auriscalpium vulgare]